MFLDSAQIDSNDISGVMTFGPYDYVPEELLPIPIIEVPSEVTQTFTNVPSISATAGVSTGIGWGALIGIGILAGLFVKWT